MNNLDTVTQATAKKAYYDFAESLGITPPRWESLSGEEQIKVANAMLTLGNMFITWEQSGLSEEQQKQHLKTLLQLAIANNAMKGETHVQQS